MSIQLPSHLLEKVPTILNLDERGIPRDGILRAVWESVSPGWTEWKTANAELHQIRLWMSSVVMDALKK